VALLVQRRRLGRLEGGSSTWQAVQEVRPVPTELRRLPEVRGARWGLGILGLVAFSVLPFVIPPSKASLVSVIMIYAMVGVSLVILTGWSGNVSLGQWALVGVGALIAAKMATAVAPQDFFVILLVAGLAGAVVAVVIGLPALRIKGLFLGVTTLAFALAAGGWIFTFRQLTPNGGITRPLLFGSVDISGERAYYFLCFAFLIGALAVARNLRKARFGRVLVAMRDNEKGAQAYGVPFVQTKLVAFAVSGFMASLAGALYAYHQQQIRADRFPADVSLLIFSMVVIGGMGSIGGAVLGAAFVRGTQYFLPAQWQLMVTGFGMLLLLWVFPGGLGQVVYSVRDRYLRWVADRRGVLVPSLVADRRVVDDEILEHVEEEPPPILDDEPELVTT
jgi:branched-chain amino acid transport system permease protein